MRYPALRGIIVLMYVLVFALLASTAVAALRLSETGERVLAVLGGSLAMLVLLGFAELLRVLMDIEENTRGHAPTADATLPAKGDP